MKDEIVAWDCELAHAIDPATREYCDWRKHLSRVQPNVPEGSIRNLQALVPANDLERAREEAVRGFNMGYAEGQAERDNLRKVLECALVIARLEWTFEGAHPHRAAVLRDMEAAFATPRVSSEQSGGQG